MMRFFFVFERDKLARERESWHLKGTKPRAKGNRRHSKPKNRKLSVISESFRFQSFQRWICFKSSLIFVVEMPSVRGR